MSNVVNLALAAMLRAQGDADPFESMGICDCCGRFAVMTPGIDGWGEHVLDFCADCAPLPEGDA